MTNSQREPKPMTIDIDGRTATLGISNIRPLVDTYSSPKVKAISDSAKKFIFHPEDLAGQRGDS
jgi:hypothetical protein